MACTCYLVGMGDVTARVSVDILDMCQGNISGSASDTLRLVPLPHSSDLDYIRCVGKREAPNTLIRFYVCAPTPSLNGRRSREQDTSTSPSPLRRTSALNVASPRKHDSHKGTRCFNITALVSRKLVCPPCNYSPECPRLRIQI